jgi:hypothetical protein
MLMIGGAAGAGAASPPTALPTLTLTMTGTAISVSGALASGAVDVVSKTSSRDASPVLVRLNPGATLQQALGALGAHHGDPNYVSPYGSLVFSADAPQGTTDAQTTLAPGNYVALDTVAGSPAKWPRQAFAVTAAGQPASLPSPAATVNAIDFGFSGAGTLRDGQLVRFENTGFVVHMIDALEVKSAKDAKQVTTLLLAGRDAKARRLASGSLSFMGPISTGGVQQAVVTAPPGIYVLACFMATQDGREHTRLGMERTIKVVK